MNRETILKRYFERLKFEEVVTLLQKRGLFPQPRKGKKFKKQELLPHFLKLESLVSNEELISFVEYSVTRKTRGLPAYTHKLQNTQIFDGKTDSELSSYFKKENHAISEVYQVTSLFEGKENNVIQLLFMVKEFESSWYSGEQTLDSLTAIYNCRVKIDLNKNIVTIFSGDDEVHSIVQSFLSRVFHVAQIECRIKEVISSLSWTDNASYKTALFLDLINNRLKAKKIGASFKEIKFQVDNDDIKDVTINGKDIINYYLACEYITLGKDIIQFKTTIDYNAKSLSCSFALKGKDQDILKIVIADTPNEALRNEVIELIQDEYIAMCEHGISDIKSIRKLLEAITLKFQEKEQFFSDVMKDNTLANLEALNKLLGGIGKSQKGIIQSIIDNNKVILETLKYDDIDGVLQPFEKWLRKQ
ncbi:hypothetical protein [Paenibacillus elgii]|uniref:hypothetical protein n=1 Tax=Paenibacillus elgii TaxID=189691 RepID=UPI00203E7B19|nr:hypothetical protein [Paenibacillus elgii]MCM3267856.1 hypothetical protein [Paenibacillus elgii]